MHRTALMSAVAARGRARHDDRRAGHRRPGDRARGPRRPPSSPGGWSRPLTAAVAPNGTAYLSENFAGMLVKKVPGKKLEDALPGPEGDRGGRGLAAPGRRHVHADRPPQDPGPPARRPAGSPGSRTSVPSRRNHNPDARVVYGFRHISDACAAQVPKEFGRRGTTAWWTPTRTARPGSAGPTYVAEAGGQRHPRGRARADQHARAAAARCKVHVTAEAAKATGMPACAAGLDYWFEPVPTDVERGPGGDLFVSTLTGGPEDGSLGALSRLYRVDRSTGAVHLVAAGLAGATGVAVAPNGDAYVARALRRPHREGRRGHLARHPGPRGPAAGRDRVRGRAPVRHHPRAERPARRPADPLPALSHGRGGRDSLEVMPPELCTLIDSVVDKYDAELIDLRRDLHAHPELSWAETRTTDLVAARVEQAGWRVTRLPRTGFVADLGDGGPLVALRADLDALPVEDTTDDPWTSTVAGRRPRLRPRRAHHRAARRGAGARRGARPRACCRGRVRLLFQPAEEVMPGGALHLMELGALDGRRRGSSRCTATRASTSARSGCGSARSPAPRTGSRCGSQGTGGHTSRPHLTGDLTFALAKVTTELPGDAVAAASTRAPGSAWSGGSCTPAPPPT